MWRITRGNDEATGSHAAAPGGGGTQGTAGDQTLGGTDRRSGDDSPHVRLNGNDGRHGDVRAALPAHDPHVRALRGGDALCGLPQHLPQSHAAPRRRHRIPARVPVLSVEDAEERALGGEHAARILTVAYASPVRSAGAPGRGDPRGRPGAVRQRVPAHPRGNGRPALHPDDRPRGDFGAGRVRPRRRVGGGAVPQHVHGRQGSAPRRRPGHGLPDPDRGPRRHGPGSGARHDRPDGHFHRPRGRAHRHPRQRGEDGGLGVGQVASAHRLGPHLRLDRSGPDARIRSHRPHRPPAGRHRGPSAVGRRPGRVGAAAPGRLQRRRRCPRGPPHHQPRRRPRGHRGRAPLRLGLAHRPQQRAAAAAGQGRLHGALPPAGRLHPGGRAGRPDRRRGGGGHRAPPGDPVRHPDRRLGPGRRRLGRGLRRARRSWGWGTSATSTSPRGGSRGWPGIVFASRSA